MMPAIGLGTGAYAFNASVVCVFDRLSQHPLCFVPHSVAYTGLVQPMEVLSLSRALASLKASH